MKLFIRRAQESKSALGTYLILIHLVLHRATAFQSNRLQICRLSARNKPPSAMSNPIDNTRDTIGNEWLSGESGSLERLCTISLQACMLMNPLISEIYNELVSTDNECSVKTVKQDNSAFTIADGLVQRMFVDILFSNAAFRDIVGEEDAAAVDQGEETTWDHVQGLVIPQELRPLVETTKENIRALAKSLDNTKSYQDITIFIDPIDGTREFSTGKGEQCSVCIGFANEYGTAVAGVVYRPLTPRPTWAAGAKCEGYAACDFGENVEKFAGGGVLTSNGSISPFIEGLIHEFQTKRIKTGGAGNKMLLLFERSLQQGKSEGNQIDATPSNSLLYIQDRGVSRWDTCAAEAVLEAFGGKILKLTHILDSEMNDMSGVESQGRYHYLASETNLDFVPGRARLTKYNSIDSETIQLNQLATDVRQVKPYSNLCGLVAFGKEWNSERGLTHISQTILKAAQMNEPSYD
ncbi:hypothetical protein HJC23_013342 [Cyclotella cryptica]|uniref:3'(2'),5'-bisphosphate nucleotidase 1 n=1 Tax=Cyclotella cryptica TaxID=29204 RepID=A0ABD3P8N0_9STRA